MRFFESIMVVVISGAMMAIAPIAFSESAPVFDADSMPQSFEAETNESPASDVLPPSPSSNQDSGFVPVSPSSGSGSGASSSAGNLEQRLKRAEQQINDIQNSESVAHIESLQDQVRALRNQVEELTHHLEQFEAQQKLANADLDKKLSEQITKANKKALAGITSDTAMNNESNALSDSKPVSSVKPKKITTAKQSIKATVGANTVVAEAETKKSQDSQPNVAEEQQIYQTAYNFIKEKKYNEAVDALQKMLKKYPSGQFASNAHYWLGELYGLMGKNDLALSEFNTVVSTYPDSPRISDAQLKVGLIYATESKWSEAKSVFKKVINRYPGTASAHVAAEQLKQIKSANH